MTIIYIRCGIYMQLLNKSTLIKVVNCSKSNRTLFFKIKKSDSDKNKKTRIQKKKTTMGEIFINK